MKSKIFFSLATLITVFSCNNNSADADFSYDKIITADSTDTAKVKLLSDSVVTNNNQATIVTAPPTSNTSASTPRLNPEHGKPGHRCEIAVGAPLNSKPTTTSTTPQKQPPAIVTPNKTVTAPGMNPPHGEPGHRCEIAVGAPLNSKPVSPIVNDTSKK